RRLAELPAPLAGHVVRHVDRFLDVAARLVQDLAHLARHVAREVLLVLHQYLGGAVEDLAALGGGQRLPARVRLARAGDRPLDVFGSRVGEAADQLGGVGGVAVVERASGSGVLPGPADVVAVALRHYALSPARADMSLVPRKLAPSAITIRGARMLPVSRPVDSSTTRSVAWQSPITSPATTTVWAETSALTVPPGAMRSSAVSRMLPSTVPSTSTASAPCSSPLSCTFEPITH